MDNTVIVTTPAQLQSLVYGAVRSILPELANYQPERPKPDVMGIEETLAFLEEQAIPTKKSALYNLVYKEEIPYRKIGRRLVFSRKELLTWIESRTVRPEDKRTAAALRIAESANRK